MVSSKIWKVLLLADPDSSIRDCKRGKQLIYHLIALLGDLWGPLINSLLLGMTAGIRATTIGTSSVSIFTLIFSLIWIGGMVVAGNARLLGYQLNLLPTVAFLGYSVSPLMMASLLLMISPGWWVIRIPLILSATAWSVMATVRLLDLDPALEDRRLLAAVPMVVYVALLAWIL